MVLGDIIKTNMVVIREYINLLKVDVLSMLDNSSDRGETLETLITQLELRYKT